MMKQPRGENGARSDWRARQESGSWWDYVLRCYKGPIEVLPVQNTTGKDLLHFCSHSKWIETCEMNSFYSTLESLGMKREGMRIDTKHLNSSFYHFLVHRWTSAHRKASGKWLWNICLRSIIEQSLSLLQGYWNRIGSVIPSVIPNESSNPNILL